jgi:hypothetical protein
VEHVHEAVCEEDGAHRQVAAGECLRGDHDVGAQTVVFGGEPGAGTAVSGGDLVGDEQDAVVA